VYLLKYLIFLTILFFGFVYLVKLGSFLFPPDPSDLSYEEKLERNCRYLVETNHIRALERAQQNGVSWLLENGYKSAMGYAFAESNLFLIGHPDCVNWRRLKHVKETQFEILKRVIK